MLLVVDLLDLVMDTRFARPLAWLLRLVGVLALAAAAYYWLFAARPSFELPAALLAVGVLLVVGPELLWSLRGPEP